VIRQVVGALSISLALAAAATAQAPQGGEFQINTYTPGLQYRPATASDADGNFVVVWESYGDGSSLGVFARRFSAAGVPRGPEFQVNTHWLSTQYRPAVASDANGNFVVVWEDYYQEGTFSVFGRRFNASGVAQGSEFRINSYTTGAQRFADVASDASGNFVVVWASSGQDGNGYGIFGQRFNAAAAPQGPEFQVSTYTTAQQREPSLASDANGNFVVIWESYGQDGSGNGVFGQRFDAGGARRGSEFRVNSFTTGLQDFPDVASDANGNFVVAWESLGQYSAGYGVFGQRFDASGVRQGSEFRANPTGDQFKPAVGADRNGNFVIVWHSYPGGEAFNVFGQRFNAGGVRQGDEFKVNTYTTDNQYWPAVAVAANGNFVVTWMSDDQDGSATGIFGQRYGDLIFEDGFDSGALGR
jgi:hypothetical protein